MIDQYVQLVQLMQYLTRAVTQPLLKCLTCREGRWLSFSPAPGWHDSQHLETRLLE